jgi:hypothetical protein
MAFDERTVQAVWEKGRGTQDRDAAVWRMDECGAWMRRNQYDHDGSEYGWKIEGTVAGGGAIDDLRPFQRENGFDLNTGQARCVVTADRQALPPTAEVDTPHNRTT